MIDILIISAIILIAITFVLIARTSEKKAYNKGICPDCGTPLRHFDDDSQGGRGYCCDECGYKTWCSYNIDKPGRTKSN